MKKKFTYEDYRDALKGAPVKVKEHILDRALEDRNIEAYEFQLLLDYAYPDREVC